MVPTFWGSAIAITIREGEDAGLTPAEILNEVEDLTDASITAFPCTNAFVGPFCEEYNISP